MAEKLVYPSATRNRDAIAACLDAVLPATGNVLEIASGSGQHISWLANNYKDIEWQPSDMDEAARDSIEAWRRAHNGANLAPPLDIDVTMPDWWRSIDTDLDGMIAINMIHIAPWEATRGLMLGAGELLKPGGFLYLYGPYKIYGAHTAPSNAAFDDSLRARNRNWGVRDKDDVARIAAQHDLRLAELIAMPVNNFSLIFRKE